MAYRLSVRASTSGVQAVFFWGIYMSEQELYKRVHELLEYKDGSLFWKIARKGAAKGAKAGSKSRPYKKIMIDKKGYYEHRIIFLMHYQYIPISIDHINMNKLDNSIENLRPATASQNAANIQKSNKSNNFLKGAWWHKKQNKWVSGIEINRKQIHLGSFETAEQAHEAYKQAAIKHFGEFARF